MLSQVMVAQPRGASRSESTGPGGRGWGQGLRRGLQTLIGKQAVGPIY